MSQINSHEDFEKLIGKYAERLKVARTKYAAFEAEVAVLKRVLNVPAPATTSESVARDYDSMIKSANREMKEVDQLCKEFDDKFDRCARTLKLFK